MKNLFNSKINIEYPIKTADAYGSHTIVWATKHSSVACRINWLSGGERIYLDKNTWVRDARIYCAVIDISVVDRISSVSKTDDTKIDVNNDGSVTAGGSQLTSTAGGFTATDVAKDDVLYIEEAGSNLGAYDIKTKDDDTHVTINGTFVATQSNLDYKIYTSKHYEIVNIENPDESGKFLAIDIKIKE